VHEIGIFVIEIGNLTPFDHDTVDFEETLFSTKV